MFCNRKNESVWICQSRGTAPDWKRSSKSFDTFWIQLPTRSQSCLGNKIPRQSAHRKNNRRTLYDELVEKLSEEKLWGRPSAADGRPILLPIPISSKRRRERGWNQCEIIAEELQKLDGGKNFELCKNILVKTKIQATKSAKEDLLDWKILRILFPSKMKRSAW